MQVNEKSFNQACSRSLLVLFRNEQLIPHTAINDNANSHKEVHFRQKKFCIIDNCAKYIHLVTDDGLYNQNAFYKVKIVFIHPLWWQACLHIIYPKYSIYKFGQ